MVNVLIYKRIISVRTINWEKKWLYCNQIIYRGKDILTLSIWWMNLSFMMICSTPEGTGETEIKS